MSQQEKNGTPNANDSPSLHIRRRGELPTSLSVKVPNTPSDAEASSPCTAGPTPEDNWSFQEESITDTEAICDSIIQQLKDENDPLSVRGRELALKTKKLLRGIEQYEVILDLLESLIQMKDDNEKMLDKLRDVEKLTKLHEAKNAISIESAGIYKEYNDLQLINEALDEDLEMDFDQALFDNVLGLGFDRSMKRTGSRWKGHSKFAGSLLKKQRSRSAGGDESDISPGTPIRRRSEVTAVRIPKEIEKSKVSKWTKVKAAFKWEKAQWTTTVNIGGAASAAGALVGVVALAGSAPSSAMNHGEPRDSASLTPGSVLSLTPNSSSEELRMETSETVCRKSAVLRCELNDSSYLQAPIQDDSSTSPSPNKLHKSPWGKMRDIIQTKRESVRKKSRSTKSSPDVIPSRRRSFSDGGESDAPPVLTLTIPSSEELESEPSHPVLRKQRSLELSTRPPQHRPPRPSKWSKVKRAFLTSASASVPSSPSRHSAFFTDAETEAFSSGCEAGCGVREEIARDYAALQSRLCQEFSDRQGKLHSGHSALRPVATEEQLSNEFRKKLDEWQRIKGGKQPPPVPARQDLSEDFLKKWDDWNRMKDTNSVPTWEGQAKTKEVLVQTSTGLFKFKGISRSFTRKLHEWEKSRGIAPEASTSALLRAAREHNNHTTTTQLTRTQSDGSVAPSANGSGRMHASSLSVNDVDHMDLEFRDINSLDGGDDVCDGSGRGAVLVEVEDEEICTAAPLFAVSPKMTPQKPIYTYGHAEARLLCETSSAVTGTAVIQANGTISDTRDMKKKEKSSGKAKNSSREQIKSSNKNKRQLVKQPSIEEDARFIRKTIEEIERGSSSRLKVENESKSTNEISDSTSYLVHKDYYNEDVIIPTTSKYFDQNELNINESKDELSNGAKDDGKKKDNINGKKKSKSKARLERELSKPSESDTEQEVEVTVEIPRRRKRPRRPSERPKTPSLTLQSDSEEQVFVLKLKATDQKEGSPEVIVKTTRKIFSPVVRSGETVATAVIPVDVEELTEVKSNDQNPHTQESSPKRQSRKSESAKTDLKQGEFSTSKSKSAGDLQEREEQRTKNRPPLPSSPSTQRKSKETAPSIRIMIQRYNKKITEEGHTSGASSGTSSPAWRSPTAERRRPLDMPVSVNIRNNPFLEREVQKSASACQLWQREHNSSEKRLAVSLIPVADGVLKSHSANTLHSQQIRPKSPSPVQEEPKHETEKSSTSNNTVVPDLTRNLPEFKQVANTFISTQSMPNALRKSKSTPRPASPCIFERSVSAVETLCNTREAEEARISERTAKLKEAREKFLASSSPMRREGTNSAGDLRPGDRSSQTSYESNVVQMNPRPNDEVSLGRSASTGMVNVDQESWQRVAQGNSSSSSSSRARFSLSRLAAKLRRKDEGAVSRLCRQSLLVQLRNKQ